MSAREALLDLCDMDLAAGDAARARHWLERIPVLLTGVDPAVLLRRAECALAFADVETARDAAAKLGEASPLDGRAALLVSHRYSSVQLADHIYVMHRGRVVEHGSHGELVAAGGRYAELYALQAQAYGTQQPGSPGVGDHGLTTAGR